MNHKPTRTFPMENFPTTGILCNVDINNNSFRLGKLMLQFPVLVDNINEHSLFLENLLVLELVDMHMPVQYQEEVAITYVTGPLVYNDSHNSSGDFVSFCGLSFSTKRGLILEMGIQSALNSGEMSYIFKYYPKNLKSNNVDWYDLHKSVNEVW